MGLPISKCFHLAISYVDMWNKSNIISIPLEKKKAKMCSKSFKSVF